MRLGGQIGRSTKAVVSNCYQQKYMHTKLVTRKLHVCTSPICIENVHIIHNDFSMQIPYVHSNLVTDNVLNCAIHKCNAFTCLSITSLDISTYTSAVPS